MTSLNTKITTKKKLSIKIEKATPRIKPKCG